MVRWTGRATGRRLPGRLLLGLGLGLGLGDRPLTRAEHAFALGRIPVRATRALMLCRRGRLPATATALHLAYLTGQAAEFGLQRGQFPREVGRGLCAARVDRVAALVIADDLPARGAARRRR